MAVTDVLAVVSLYSSRKFCPDSRHWVSLGSRGIRPEWLKVTV